MSEKNTKVPSIYWPVDVTLFLCDGPECTNCALKEYMVGWLVMGPQGTVALTMGSIPDAMDFCSLLCLKTALDMMTGSA